MVPEPRTNAVTRKRSGGANVLVAISGARYLFVSCRNECSAPRAIGISPVSGMACLNRRAKHDSFSPKHRDGVRLYERRLCCQLIFQVSSSCAARCRLAKHWATPVCSTHSSAPRRHRRRPLLLPPSSYPLWPRTAWIRTLWVPFRSSSTRAHPPSMYTRSPEPRCGKVSEHAALKQQASTESQTQKESGD